MTRIVTVAVVLCAAAARVPGQPGISQNGVVNLASQIPPTLPGGAIARGALFSISGIRFGTLDRTQVTMSQGESSVAVPIVKVLPRRIEARMPRSAPLGSGSLVVTVDGKPSRPFPVEIVVSNPGIFSRNGEGWGPGRIDNIASSGARSANSTSNPAHPGSRVALVTTGLGNKANGTRLVLGGRLAPVIASRATAKPGEEELTIRIPANAPEGCYVPLYIPITPTRAGNVVTIAIRSRPGPCDPSPLPPPSPRTMGIAVLSRTVMRAVREGAPESIRDDARVAFIATAEGSAPLPIQLLPPLGSCTALTSSYQTNTNLANSVARVVGIEGRGLDAGARLILSRAGESRPVPQGAEGQGNYFSRLGTGGYETRRHRDPAPFLEPGEFTLRGAGGREVGPFALSFSVPAPFEWTDREQTRVVDRSRGVTIHWKGGTAEQVMFILARNIDQITTAIGMCLCTASGAAGQITMPAPLLANIPATQDVAGVPYNELVVGSLTLRPGIKASGLDGGFGAIFYAIGRYVEYR